MTIGQPALSLCLLSLCLGMPGCHSYQFTTLVIYDSPGMFVRLEVDRTTDGAGHSHPAHISHEQMAAALKGIVVNEPAIRLPIYDDLSRPRRHPAFSEKEVAVLAPLLALGLDKATPEELVTFYQSRDLSGTSREVTSGGLFVQGDELHIMLPNYRSSTHFSADIGVAETTDDRLTPLRSLAPQRGQLDFEPQAAKREVVSEPLSGWFQQNRREVIVLYKLLPS